MALSVKEYEEMKKRVQIRYDEPSINIQQCIQHPYLTLQTNDKRLYVKEAMNFLKLYSPKNYEIANSMECRHIVSEIAIVKSFDCLSNTEFFQNTIETFQPNEFINGTTSPLFHNLNPISLYFLIRIAKDDEPFTHFQLAYLLVFQGAFWTSLPDVTKLQEEGGRLLDLWKESTRCFGLPAMDPRLLIFFKKNVNVFCRQRRLSWQHYSFLDEFVAYLINIRIQQRRFDQRVIQYQSNLHAEIENTQFLRRFNDDILRDFATQNGIEIGTEIKLNDLMNVAKSFHDDLKTLGMLPREFCPLEGFPVERIRQLMNALLSCGYICVTGYLRRIQSDEKETKRYQHDHLISALVTPTEKKSGPRKYERDRFNALFEFCRTAQGVSLHTNPNRLFITSREKRAHLPRSPLNIVMMPRGELNRSRNLCNFKIHFGEHGVARLHRTAILFDSNAELKIPEQTI